GSSARPRPTSRGVLIRMRPVRFAAVVPCAITFWASVALAQKVLPSPEPPFQGVANRTLADSKPDYPRPVQAPQGAPNILLILIDDAGFGNPSTFGGPVPDADARSPRPRRAALQPIPRDRALLPDPCRATLGSQSPRRGIRLHRRGAQRVARLQRDVAAKRRLDCRDPARQRLQHGGLRQVAPHAGHPSRSKARSRRWTSSCTEPPLLGPRRVRASHRRVRRSTACDGHAALSCRVALARARH